MKIAVYSPYLDTAAGGERYMLTIAECLSEKNEVFILLDEKLEGVGWDEIKKRNENMHGVDLSSLRPMYFPVSGGNLISKSLLCRKFDWFFLNSDGSVFFPTAKNNVVHFQLPVNLDLSLWSRVKLSFWKKAIYNSQFTAEFIERQFGLGGQVVYPPVDIAGFKGGKKEKKILSVGRFVDKDNPKKQDVMIEAFINMKNKFSLKGWSLHLAGSLTSGNEGYLDRLKNMTEGHDVYFYPNISLEDLVLLYGESAIYWHAMGYGETDPKRFEHFGISTVEAMASGCVPVVINKGGQTEIVESGKSGLLWDDLEQLESLTAELIADKKLYNSLSENAILRSKNFSKEKFVKEIKELVDGS